MRLWAAALAILAFLTPARSEPLDVIASRIDSFQNLSANTHFGPLEWRGGLSLSSDNPGFGGLSGLVLGDGCQELTAISDAGRWFTARLVYENGGLAGLSGGAMAPMRDSKGNPQRSKVWADAEAIARLSPGRYAVAYESRVRFGTYDLGRDGTSARFNALSYPKEIDKGPDNGEVEALGLIDAGPLTGHFIAIAERNRDPAGATRAWAWRGKAVIAFSVQRFEDYSITDLAVLPDGAILTLERSFSRTSLPGMAIRRFSSAMIAAGATIEPELLFAGRFPFYAIDNMEGIAVCARDGETRLTVLSDNNFNTSLQRTLLLQFALRD